MRSPTWCRLLQAMRRPQTLRRARILALGAAAAVMFATACGSDSDPSSVTPSTSSASTTASTDVAEPGIADRFAVAAGHKLAMSCLGEGSPVIILESGTDGSGIEEYGQQLEPLAERTMTCTYDRPGAGQSDPPSEEHRRTLDDAAADLHDLVDAAGIKSPFVLVGSSGGGLLVVDYAGRYPGQVAGLVLLDVPAPVPDLAKEFPGAKGWRNQEHLDYVAAERQLALHPPQLGDIPLRVVTATDGASDVKDQEFWLDLSSRAEQTTLEGGHDLSSDNPNGVVAEIQSALDAIQGERND
jgi:alpha/beta hydrolase family protein